MYKQFLLILILFSFNGCAMKEIEYVPKIIEKEVYIPYIPDLPEIECKFRGESTEVMKQMLDCLALHKKVLNSLRTKEKQSFYKGANDAIYNRK